MYSSISALAEGIGAQADTNRAHQMTTANFVLALVQATFPLQEAWAAKLQEDANRYYVDSLEAVSHPAKSAQAAADNVQKGIDSKQSNVEMGDQTNLIETAKAQAQMDGKAMATTFTLEVPVMSYVQKLTDALLGFV